MKNRLLGIIIIIIVGAILSECSSADRNSEGEIATQGELDAFETRVGDCFAELPSEFSSEEAVEFDTLNAIPCSEAHRWQVVHKGYISSLSEYSESAIQEQSSKICEEAYKSLFLSMSDFKYEEYKNAQSISFFPTPKSWDNGDKTVDCLIGSDTSLFYTSILD
jgi:hypothetical protein